MLFGRQAEQERLFALLAAARGGESGALLIVGEAGAGKSALFEAVRSAGSDFTVLEASGVESEAQLPFGSLHQLLFPWLNRVDALPPLQAAALRGALGLREGGASDPYRVGLGVLTLLGEAAEERPVACLIDDAHWLDPDSRRTLVFVARRLQAEGVVMLLAARPDRFDAGSIRPLVLGALQAPAVAEVLAERSGVPAALDVAQRLTTATGGNALAIVELASLLSPGQLSGIEPLPSPLPMSSGIECLFADRVRALPPETRRFLLVAAADDTGRPNVVLGAAERLGLDAAGLDRGEEADLLSVDSGGIHFRHPLIRAAVYGTATFADRRATHRSLADVLRAAGEVDRFAWHLAAATPGPDAEVVDALDQAAQRARAREAYAAAAAAAEKAADASALPADRGRRLLEAASDAWLAGLLPQAARLAESAEALVDDPIAGASCHRLRGAIELAAGTSTNAVRTLVRAAGALAEFDQRRALELLALAGEGAALNHDVDTSIAIAELAESIDVSGDKHDQFLSRLLIGFGHHLAGDTKPAIGALREALAVVENERDDVDLMLAAGRAGFYAGDDGAALRFHGRIVARARSIGSVGCLAIGGTRLALAELVVGRWSNGLATAEETSRLAEDTGQVELQAHALVWRALIASWRGEEARCRELVERARAITSKHPMALTDDASRWVLGVLELGAGQPAAAFAQLEPIAHPVVTTLASLDRIEAAQRAGHRAQAAIWLGELEEFAVASEAPWAQARLAHCRAAVCDDDDDAAERFLAEALAAHATAGRPFERARTELAFGEYLRRRRRRVDAREHLQSALATFDELGATTWAERTRNELRASGQTARRRDPSTVDQLTPQELQIARQVAQGLSNREVAAQLFLSPRTIDFHLRKVFSKLGISSRTELAALRFDRAPAAPPQGIPA